MFNKLGLQALLLLLDIADHVKYITYNETNDDCKIPLVGLNSCTLGNRLIIVAIKHKIKLNVIKKTCNPQPEAFILIKLVEYFNKLFKENTNLMHRKHSQILRLQSLRM